MTREELVQMREYKVAQASTEYYNKHPKADPISAFEDGVAWADEHPKNPWISVEERLPEDNKTVLVWFGGCYKVALLRDNQWWECTGYQTGGGWSALDKIPDIASSYITHWMTIPQIEKGE